MWRSFSRVRKHMGQTKEPTNKQTERHRVKPPLALRAAGAYNVTKQSIWFTNVFNKILNEEYMFCQYWVFFRYATFT